MKRKEVDLTLLKEFYVEKGLTLREIATRLGLSISVVRSRLIENHIPQRTFATPFETMRKLYVDERWTLRMIAAELGITQQAVHERLKRKGVAMRSSSERRLPKRHIVLKDSVDVNDLVRRYRDEKTTIRQLAEDLGEGPGTIRNLLTSVGVTTSEKFRYANPKYHAMRSLEVGESALLHLPDARNPVSNIHSVAGFADMRVKVRIEPNKSYRVTRIR